MRRYDVNIVMLEKQINYLLSIKFLVQEQCVSMNKNNFKFKFVEKSHIYKTLPNFEFTHIHQNGNFLSIQDQCTYSKKPRTSSREVKEIEEKSTDFGKNLVISGHHHENRDIQGIWMLQHRRSSIKGKVNKVAQNCNTQIFL